MVVGYGRRMMPKRLPSHVPVRRRTVRTVRRRVRLWEVGVLGGGEMSSRRNFLRPIVFGGVERKCE